MPHDVPDDTCSDRRQFVDRLAYTLLEEASGHSVRVIEAVAAVLVNGLDRGPIAAADGWHLAEDPAPFAHDGQGDDDPRLAMCRRVARRALGRSLADPTGGATAFHRLDAAPAWAHDHLPVATLGPFLFYRL